MRWTIHRADDARALDRWHRLNTLHANADPGLHRDFVATLLKHFGTGRERIGIAQANGETVAGAIVTPSGKGVWQLFSPDQVCCACLIVSKDVQSLAAAMRTLLEALPGYCWLLRMKRLDPALQPGEELRTLEMVEVAPFGTTYAIHLEGDFEAYWSGRSKSVRRGVRRAMSRLQQSNVSVRLLERRSRDEMVEAVRLHGQLESGGWKGRNGTAIHADNSQGKFYVDLLSSFAERDGALTFQLYLGERLAASVLCVESNGTVGVLKTTYNEDLAQYGPGRLLDYCLLQKCFAYDRHASMEMYTLASDQDLQWATEQRVLYLADVYRTPLLKRAAAIARKLPMKSWLTRVLPNG